MRIKSTVFLAIVAVGIAAYLNRSMPHEQRCRFVLGGRASVVTDLSVAYAAVPNDGDVDREVTFHFAPGAAPGSVMHEPKLKNGPYDVHVDVTAGGRHTAFVRRVEFDGHGASVDLSELPLAESTP